MPTYDYLCAACGHRFEEFQSMSAKPLRTCPECKKRALRRLIGAGAGVIFKGSGFYQTDYKQSGGKETGGKDTGGKDTGGKETGGKEKKSDAGPPAGGCSPKCGTDDAPAGCRMTNKKGD